MARVVAVTAVVLAAVIFIARHFSLDRGRQSAAETTVSSTTTPTGPLVAPVTTVIQDGLYLKHVTEADPSLVTYEKTYNNVALRALLTDGSAFCAFLDRYHDLDTAMVSIGVGARQSEKTSHLPLTVTTFNTIDALALIDLCPTDQTFVSASTRKHLRSLAKGLS